MDLTFKLLKIKFYETINKIEKVIEYFYFIYTIQTIFSNFEYSYYIDE